VRAIPKLLTQFLYWHTRAISGIHRAALDYVLNRDWVSKNELTELELDLLWHHVEQKGNDKIKQYLAWLLVYITLRRPGSLTVCDGYQEGAALPNTDHHEEDDTLRWSDLQFVSLGNGDVRVSIMFRFTKGFRDTDKGRARTEELYRADLS
jgi:hypothetical protein